MFLLVLLLSPPFLVIIANVERATFCCSLFNMQKLFTLVKQKELLSPFLSLMFAHNLLLVQEGIARWRTRKKESLPAKVNKLGNVEI